MLAFSFLLTKRDARHDNSKMITTPGAAVASLIPTKSVKKVGNTKIWGRAGAGRS